MSLCVPGHARMRRGSPRAATLQGRRAELVPHAAQAGVAEVYRGLYPRSWAQELAWARGGEARSWAIPAARRLIGLLREGEVLPLCSERQLAADDAGEPRFPHYLAAIPLDGEQHYGALLQQHGATVQSAPAYILVDWLIARGSTSEYLDRAEAWAWAEQHAGTLVERTYAVIERADALWDEWCEVGAYSPADRLLFDMGDHCRSWDDGLRWLPTLVAYRQHYQRICEGDVEAGDNPFLSWSELHWAGYEEAGHLAWSLENVATLAELWDETRACRDEVRAVWAALTAPDAMDRLVTLLAAVLDVAGRA